MKRVLLAGSLLLLAGCSDGDRSSGPTGPGPITVTCKQTAGTFVTTNITQDCGDATAEPFVFETPAE